MHDVVIFDILLKSFKTVIYQIFWPIDFLVNFLWFNHLDILAIPRVSVGSSGQELFILCYQILQDTFWGFRRPWMNCENLRTRICDNVSYTSYLHPTSSTFSSPKHSSRYFRGASRLHIMSQDIITSPESIFV